MGNFKEDIARCEAFVFDVDGVMTDGGIIPTADGDFIRRYNAKDGYALAYAVKHGYKVCIITGGRGRTLEHRLRMLGIERFYTDCMDKIPATTLRKRTVASRYGMRRWASTGISRRRRPS